MLVRKPFNRLLQAPKAFGIVRRWFFSGSVHLIKRNQLPPRPKINEDEIEEVFIKGGFVYCHRMLAKSFLTKDALI